MCFFLLVRLRSSPMFCLCCTGIKRILTPVVEVGELFCRNNPGLRYLEWGVRSIYFSARIASEFMLNVYILSISSGLRGYLIIRILKYLMRSVYNPTDMKEKSLTRRATSITISARTNRVTFPQASRIVANRYQTDRYGILI